MLAVGDTFHRRNTLFQANLSNPPCRLQFPALSPRWLWGPPGNPPPLLPPALEAGEGQAEALPLPQGFTGTWGGFLAAHKEKGPSGWDEVASAGQP